MIDDGESEDNAAGYFLNRSKNKMVARSVHHNFFCPGSPACLSRWRGGDEDAGKPTGAKIFSEQQMLKLISGADKRSHVKHFSSELSLNAASWGTRTSRGDRDDAGLLLATSGPWWTRWWICWWLQKVWRFPGNGLSSPPETDGALFLICSLSIHFKEILWKSVQD